MIVFHCCKLALEQSVVCLYAHVVISLIAVGFCSCTGNSLGRELPAFYELITAPATKISLFAVC